MSATTARCCRYVSPGPGCGRGGRFPASLPGARVDLACLRAGSCWLSFLIVPGSVACSRPTGLRRDRCRAGRHAVCAGPRPAATGLITSGTGAMVVAGRQDDGGLRIRLVPAGQGCVRGICSAVSGDDILFMHGCALSVGAGLPAGRGYHGEFRGGEDHAGGGAAAASGIFSGGAERRLGCHFAESRGFGEHGGTDAPHEDGQRAGPSSRLLHQCGGKRVFARSVGAGSGGRMLVSPEGVYGTAWSSSGTVVDHVAVVVREPADWLPPDRDGEARRAPQEPR